MSSASASASIEPPASTASTDMPGPVVPGFLPSHPAATDSATLRLIWPPVADLGGATDVVGLTIAEFLPRRLLALSAVLADLPLVNG